LRAETLVPPVPANAALNLEANMPSRDTCVPCSSAVGRKPSAPSPRAVCIYARLGGAGWYPFRTAHNFFLSGRPAAEDRTGKPAEPRTHCVVPAP